MNVDTEGQMAGAIRSTALGSLMRFFTTNSDLSSGEERKLEVKVLRPDQKGTLRVASLALSLL